MPLLSRIGPDSNGAVDGVGWTIKQLATRAIVTQKDIVKDANSLLNAVKDKTKTNLAVINESKIKEMLSDIDIESWWEKVNAVPGTKQVH